LTVFCRHIYSQSSPSCF